MSNVEFKKMFGNLAKLHGFERAFGGWFRESDECILVLDLQRSNYSNLYYLNIKLYVRGMFTDEYGELKLDKGLVRSDVGHIFRREPKEFSTALDLENDLADTDREESLTKLFTEFLEPFSQRASTPKGIAQLAKAEEIFLLPAVKQELKELINRDA
jgi:hypothetical protein